jgi:uncharacterized protein DUF3179
MKQNIMLVLFFFSMLLWGCEEEPLNNGDAPGSGNKNGWSISKDEIFDGGPGKDGIPALEEPTFIPAGEVVYVNENDLVLGFVDGDKSRAYPHSILDWHEIVNDRLGESNITVTYCPLTGTGIGWNRKINGTVTTFGVSGLLYNSNLIPYDRETGSNWSQMRLDCVNGNLIGTQIKTFPLVETTWKTWKEMYPNTEVISAETGHNRSYGRYPYGSYRTSDDYLIFPVANEDDRLGNKDRVHAIVLEGGVRVYPLSSFGIEVSVIHDQLKGKNLVVVGNTEDNFAVSYLNDRGDGTTYSFTPVQNQYPIVISDEEGNLWDVFGTAVSGPRKGNRLAHASSFMGYWFSFAAFYPDLSIYGE